MKLSFSTSCRFCGERWAVKSDNADAFELEAALSKVDAENHEFEAHIRQAAVSGFWKGLFKVAGITEGKPDALGY